MSVPRELLAQAQSWSELLASAMKGWQHDGVSTFDTLFPIAIDGNADRAPYNAGTLLVYMDPDCHHDCRELLSRIHHSKWFVRYRELAFYLMVHFGKEHLHQQAKAFIAELPEAEREDSRLRTLIYWISGSAEELIVPMHAWMRGDTGVKGAGPVFPDPTPSGTD